jgi:superfamily II RNA helicase
MSATLGDSSFFSKQLTALIGAPTTLVQSDQRPVPLAFEYSTNFCTKEEKTAIARRVAPSKNSTSSLLLVC